MTDWMKLATAFVVVGFQLVLFGLGLSSHMVGENGAIEAMMVIGFLCYSFLFIITIGVHFGELNGKKIVLLAIVILGFAAGIFLLLGYILYVALVNSSGPGVYVSTFQILSLVLAVCTAICGLLSISSVRVRVG